MIFAIYTYFLSFIFLVAFLKNNSNYSIIKNVKTKKNFPTYKKEMRLKMRIRYKKWARPELEASQFYIDEPEEIKGKWKKQFEKSNQPLHLELGCGKGQFMAKLAVENQNTNYLAIDLVDAMLGLAKRNIEQTYQEANLEPKNVFITRFDIERIHLILDKQDEIERIYINFCNPWPRGKHRKKRLTHSIQLEKYKQFFKEGRRGLF